jgi:transcriptional regulator with XRE-family HTH domain
MPSEFGTALRAARESAGLGLSELARTVERSESFMRDVEAGRRGPLDTDATRRAAGALGLHPWPLVEAAVRQRQRVELVVDPRHAPALSLAVRLALSWDLLTDAEMEQLRACLDGMRLPDGRRTR